jgi:hypothetical protein
VQNDIRLLTPTTITLDALAITELQIKFLNEHEIVVHFKDNQDKMAAVIVRDGDSQGLAYNAGVWTPTTVSTPTGTTDIIQAMLDGALPGLSGYLLTSGLLTVTGGAEAIVPTP